VVKASLSNTCACSSEGSFSNLSWHADNKKAEPELSPQDKKGQRTAIIWLHFCSFWGKHHNSYGTDNNA